MRKLRNVVAYVVEVLGLAALLYGMYLLLGLPALYIGGGLVAVFAAQYIEAKR
jgi:hypothetical protein